MPNWCNNYIEITGKEKEVKKYLKECVKTQKLDNKSDFGDCWLGNLVDYCLGNPYETTKYNCRGYYTINEEENITLDSTDEEITVTIEAESAWTSCGEIFVDFAKAIHADVSVYWVSEEPGCCYFRTNNPEIFKEEENI